MIFWKPSEKVFQIGEQSLIATEMFIEIRKTEVVIRFGHMKIILDLDMSSFSRIMECRPRLKCIVIIRQREEESQVTTEP